MAPRGLEPRAGVSANIRRPLRPEELPHLRALGAELRRSRVLAGVSTPLSAVGYITVRQVERIEQGARRTRRSTLDWLVAVLLLPCPDLGGRDELVDRLVALAGPALAAESPYADKSAERQGKWRRLEERRAMYARLNSSRR